MRRFLLAIALIIVLGFFLLVAAFFFLASRGIFLVAESPTLRGENCEDAEELWLRNKCYLSAADRQGDASLCEKIVISLEDETSGPNKLLCYSNVARNTKNIELCDKAESYRDDCLEQYAQFHRDASACDRMSDNQLAASCKQSLPKSNFRGI